MKKPAAKVAPKIPNVKWRNGRPRFEPSPSLRKLGYKGEDLKHPDETWMTAGEALDWWRDLSRTLPAIRAEAERRARRKKPEQPKPAPSRPVYPLSQLFEEWLNAGHNPDVNDLAAKTRYEYRAKGKVIATHLEDVWHAEAAALTKAICLGMYDTLRQKTGLSLASATMRALGTALQWAIDRERVEGMQVNPAHKLRMKKPPPRVRFGSRAEIEQLIAVADAIGRSELGDMIMLGVWSGQRQADRLNFEIAGRKTGRIVLRQRKTKAIVSIPEAPLLKVRLAQSDARRKVAEIISPNVIVDERRWVPFQSQHYTHLFAELRTVAAKGLPKTETRAAIKPMPSLLTLRDQDLRDTAVTWLAMAGATIPEICSITGHEFASAHQILKHYLALNPELADSAMVKLIDWYDTQAEEL